MTSRQRILAAIRLETPDRVPVTPFGLGKLDPEGDAAADLIRTTDPVLVCRTGVDPVLGAAAKVETVVEPEGDGDISTTRYHTPRGVLTQRVQRTAVTSATIEFPLKSAEDVEKFLSIPYEAPQPDLSAFRKRKQDAGEEALVMMGVNDAVCLPGTWFAPEMFCLLWADAPDLLKQLASLAADRINAFVEGLCREGVDAFRIVGGELASVQLGPSGFDALVMPYDSELIDVMHRYGAIAYYHNHGPVTRFLGRFAEMGVDALDPLEAPPWGDVDLADAKYQIGDKVCLVGNLDDMEVVETRSIAEVEEMAAALLDKAGPDGYLLGGTASGTYTERSAKAFKALVKVAEAYGRRQPASAVN